MNRGRWSISSLALAVALAVSSWVGEASAIFNAALDRVGDGDQNTVMGVDAVSTFGDEAPLASDYWAAVGLELRTGGAPHWESQMGMTAWEPGISDWSTGTSFTMSADYFLI